MAEQLVFDLPLRPAMGRGDFFVSAANAAALAQVDGWRDWPHGKLMLVGPPGAGKTHLAHVWAAQTGAEVIAARSLDEAEVERLGGAEAVAVEGLEQIAGDSAAEARLFHLHNLLMSSGGRLLITAAAPPARLELSLPDLDSRMRQAGVAQLNPPDDALLSAVILKLAHDRALRLTPRILAHVPPRIERSFAAARRFVDLLDARALAAKAPPRLADAKAVLAQLSAPVSG